MEINVKNKKTMSIWEEYELWEAQQFLESVMRTLPYGEEVECLIINDEENDIRDF